MTEIVLGIAVIVGLVMALSAGLLVARRRLVPGGAVLVTVNGSVNLVGAPGARLLTVLHDGGVPIPAACGGSGTCGLCRVTVTGEGAGTPQATERGVLSARERRDHMRLACQTTLRGDCAVEVPQDILSAGGGFTCTVASTRMLAPLIREIVLDLPEDQPFRYRAGGFMQLTAPPYTLAFAALDVEPRFRSAWKSAGWTGACE